MTNEQWLAFDSFRTRFRERCAAWGAEAGNATGWLATLQQEAAKADATPEYPLENPIVYNHALDAITRDDKVALIVVGDNPGKDEQLEKNRRYLVGQAGKLGDGFFRRNPELKVDFRKNVIILNKTPIHTAKTKQLSYVLKKGGTRFQAIFEDSQRWMARETMELRASLGCGLWLVGYAELRQNGLFAAYAGELARYGSADDAVRLFQHFSMNRFSIDLKERTDPSASLEENLRRIGVAHRREILGW
ncbi:MAG TPA: hypothetical protein PKL75_03570 [Treponemataceae bacterium]|nr:hypothetical protein [Treponemataceae bacterium]